MRLLYTLTIAAAFFVNSLKAQLITTQTLTPQQLVQNVLLGAGVTASNITFTGNALQISKFVATTSTSLGIASGVFLSSGDARTTSAVGPQGPNNAGGTSTAHNGPGDANLNTVSSLPTEDAAVLEFDFVPSSDSVKFRYCFGSEEYPEFAPPNNSSFNDVFAFFLTGPNPLGGTYTNKNIALIPGTTTPVAINNVNPITNATYYRSNTGNVINCEFDGFTKVIYALEHVICGQPYHIKIALADAGDGSWDSGVFLEAGSFSSIPPLNLNTTNANSNIPDSILVEDCNTNCINFIRNGNVANADSFSLQVSGNALLGLDYIQAGNPGFTWPTTIYFAAGQDTLKFCNLTALQDGLNEGLDTIKFTMASFITNTLSCLSSNEIKFNLYVKDYTPISIAQNDVTLCSGTSTILNAGASGGYPTYTYSISAPAVTTPTLNTGPVNATTIYTITVNDICNKPITKQITVTPVAIPTVTVNDTTLCAGNIGLLYATGAATYSWSSGATTSSINVTPTITTNYTVVGSVGTCSSSAISTVSVIGQAISITGTNTICEGQSTLLTASGGTAYTWNDGTTTNTILVTPTTNTSYTVTSVAATCTNMAVFNVIVVPIPTVTINGNVTCQGQNTTLTANGATSYTWSTGSFTNTTTVNPTVNTTYTVTGAVASCTNTSAYTVTVIPTPTIVTTNSLICGGDSAILIASGGLTYVWDNGLVNDTLVVQPNVTTNYTVVGSVGTCTSLAVATVSVISPAVVITGSTSICIGQTVLLTATGGSTYSWNTGASTNTILVTPTVTTTYSATSIVATCTTPAVHTISVTPKPVINVAGTTICPGQNGTITATGATTYTWSTGQQTSSITVNPTVNTTYTVIGTTIPTCTDTATYTMNIITAKPELNAFVGPPIFCLDSIGAVRLVIANGNPPYTVNWIIPVNGITPFDTINNAYFFNQSVTPSNEYYTIIVTDQCLYTDTVVVNLQTVDCNIIVPNVVTPNGDGINDFFRINGLDNFSGSALSVFNRWGNKIYTNDDYKNDWAPDTNDGTYFYTLNMSDGRTFSGFFQVFKN